MKKLSVILLGTLLCICFALLPTQAKAAEKEGYLTYAISNGEVTIMDCDENASGKIVIPETIKGYPVTKILGYTFSSCDSITSITIPVRVKTIGTLQCVAPVWVDENNPYLTSDSKGVVYSKDMKTLFGVPASLTGVYTVPDGVETIESRAFATCENLTQITLPESVTTIEAGAFAWCTKLESVNIPAGVKDLGGVSGYMFIKCSSLKSIVIPEGVTAIPESTFMECTSLETVELPYTVTFIGFEAFLECTSLKTIDLSHVTEIEESAFQMCTSLSGKLVLAEGLTQIDIAVFANCWSLEEVVLPESLTEIGDGAFAGCQSLEKLDIHAGVTYVGEGSVVKQAFCVAEDNPNYASDSYGVLYTKDMQTLISAPREIRGCYNVPNGVITIERGAFRRCKNLTEIIIPEKVETIGEGAFAYCTNLKTVNVPETLTIVEKSAFEHCTSLTDVPTFKNVTSLSYLLFRGCTGFVSVTVPEGVQEISSYAFGDCTSLTAVRLPASVKKINMRAFEDCTALKQVYAYASKSEIAIDNFVHANDYLLNAEWIVHRCTWNEGVITIEPSCTQQGAKEYTCIECGRTISALLNGVRHEIEEAWNVDAQNHWRVCKNCDYKQGWLGHTPGPEATADAAQICTVCGYEIAPKLAKEEPIDWIWVIVGVAVLLAGGAAATVIILKKKRQ